MSTKSTPRPQDWQELYQLAMLETDPAKLPPLIVDAQRAILDRIQETIAKPVFGEQERLSDSLCGLRTLRNEVNSWKNRSIGDSAGLRESG